MNELASCSIRSGETRITEDVFRRVLPPFSKTIAESFGEEVRPEFPEAFDYLRSLSEADFTEGSFTMKAEGVKGHFGRLLPRYGATIHGRRLNQTSPESPFEIWSIFYQAGVLNARVSDTSMKSSFRHLDPLADPFLVTRSRWNDLQSMLWEVNPVYRDFLIGLQDDLSKREGLAKKPKSKHRHD